MVVKRGSPGRVAHRSLVAAVCGSGGEIGGLPKPTECQSGGTISP